MNRLLFLLLAVAVTACNTPTASIPEKASATQYPDDVASGTIYEVNIRQHTPEGTLAAFTKDIPRLKELGVDVLWIMPVQPIGVKNRKEPLGSYYSIRDYGKVNPEFGTEEDFRNLVNKAHELKMHVILDWVPNHTAWDHPWITEHPEYYAKKPNGEIAYEADWTDIALLNHENPALRAAMIEEMKKWVVNYDIDGFRCDHAGHEIPLYLWEEARAAIDPIKDLFWLAEWDGARMHLTFDATYAWPLLAIQDKVGRGEATANDLADWIFADMKEYGRRPYRMMIVTNHDENSWKGTEFERYGEGVKTFATFAFTAYGIPMLYTGQEVGMNKRLKFFDKDTIDWSDPMQMQPFYKKLTSLHASNPALHAGVAGGMPVRINDRSEAVYAYQRTKGSNTVVTILNFSGKPQACNILDASVAGTYKDYFTGDSYELSTSKPLEVKPWQYLVFVK